MLWYQSRIHSKEALDDTIKALYNDKWYNLQGNTIVVDSHTPDNIAWKILREGLWVWLTGQTWWPQFILAMCLRKLTWWCILETPTGGDKPRYAGSGGLLSSLSSKFQVQWEIPASKTKVTSKKRRHAMSASDLHTHTHTHAHVHTYTCTHIHTHTHSLLTESLSILELVM